MVGKLDSLTFAKKINMRKENFFQPTTSMPTTVDEYLATLPGDVRDALEKLRRTIKSIVPGAEERIAYRIPIFRLERDLVGFSAQRNPQKRLCSFYTMSPPLVKAMKKDLQNYRVSGATIHFIPEKPLPAALVKKIVRARVKELSVKARKYKS
ncbi:hypothetical protein NTE_01131 [Candidatus Nitrososphaera evergladensis SR1]|uniref:YdhG-like domain-containing protein n=1 Tax=Candidatus Nitrososphaera evergladensis SR1 TaxID=1459636 RepID=A0A075MVA3_9ARCH|nr:DUF1801 domain-containing protein [Candidatus Nitrososphaera evergladensis]AIF83204.1 hypothetical protein NTE_01131 [Candidatus Nitrososphaera evergladensis SR1]